MRVTRVMGLRVVVSSSAFTSSSGPESVMCGSVPARGWARGFAQYSLNVRAAGLSGPMVSHDASQAFLTHAFALSKSETYCAIESTSYQRCIRGSYHNAKLERIEAEGCLVMHEPFFLHQTYGDLDLKIRGSVYLSRAKTSLGCMRTFLSPSVGSLPHVPISSNNLLISALRRSLSFPSLPFSSHTSQAHTNPNAASISVARSSRVPRMSTSA